jgi:hypothetical protein
MIKPLPAWLPPIVKEHAHRFYAEAAASGSAEELAMLERITTSPAIKKVWDYLQTKRRVQHQPTTEYRHPVHDPMAGVGNHSEDFPTRAEWRQQMGLAAIYERAHQFGVLCLPSRIAAKRPPREAPEEFRNPPNVFQTQAADLRAVAEEWSRIWAVPSRERGEKRFATELTKLIDQMRSLADGFDALEKVFHEQWEFHTKPGEVAAAVTANIATTMDQVFGEPMYGQTATISSLVLNQPITRERARGHYHGVWGPGVKFRL